MTALVAASMLVMLQFDGYVNAIYERNTAPIGELADIRVRVTDIRSLLWRMVALRDQAEKRPTIEAIQVDLTGIEGAWARYHRDDANVRQDTRFASEIGLQLPVFSDIVRVSLSRFAAGDQDSAREWLERHADALGQLDALIEREVALNVAMAAALRQDSADTLSYAIGVAFSLLIASAGASIALVMHLAHQRDDAVEASRYHLWLADRAIEMTLDGVMITDADGTIEKVNPAFCRLTGYSQAELVGKTPRLFSSGRQPPECYRALWAALKEQGQWKGELWNRRKDGHVYLESLSIAGIRQSDGAFTHFVAVCTDITQRQQTEERLGYLATHDMLTGLPNRFLLDERLNQAIARARRTLRQVAVMFLDLDGFKAVNDTMGHGVGDELLILIARDLMNAVRDSDTVARLGGDEFAIVLEDVEEPERLPALAQRLLRMIGVVRRIGEYQVFVTSSIGIALYPEDASNPQDLLNMADGAMYQAKRRGKNAFCLASSASVDA